MCFYGRVVDAGKALRVEGQRAVGALALPMPTFWLPVTSWL